MNLKLPPLVTEFERARNRILKKENAANLTWSDTFPYHNVQRSTLNRHPHQPAPLYLNRLKCYNSAISHRPTYIHC